MRKNKYINCIVDSEKAFEGKIRTILNNAKIEIDECIDIYRPEAVSKKQLEIVDKAVGAINQVQDQYLKVVADELDRLASNDRATKVTNKSNTEKLLEQIKLSNDIKMNEIKMACMNNDELLELANDSENNILINQIKGELVNRANLLEDKTERQQLIQSARMIQEYTVEHQIKQAKIEFDIMIADRNMLLPGMAISEKLTINNAGGIRSYLMKDIEVEYKE